MELRHIVRRGLLAAAFLSGSLFCPVVWGVADNSSFIRSETLAEAEFEMCSGDGCSEDPCSAGTEGQLSDMEINPSFESFTLKGLGGDPGLVLTQDELDIDIGEEDCLTGVRTEISVDLEMETRDGVVTCTGPSFGNPPEPEPVDCPVGEWFQFDQNSIEFNGTFPTKIEISDSSGVVEVRATTAQVQLLIQATSPADNIQRGTLNRALEGLLSVARDREEGETDVDHFLNFLGHNPGSFNQVGQTSLDSYLVEASGSILIDGREYLDGVDWGEPEGAFITTKEHFVLNNVATLCGDGICDEEVGEDSSSCSEDCFCGNGICELEEDPPGETPPTCGVDCPFCGDGICAPFRETGTSCAEDCDSSCSNGICEFWYESHFDPNPACATECRCGDGLCNFFDGEFAHNCYEDCGSCGDGQCTSPPEDFSNCPEECPECGDGICSFEFECLEQHCMEDCGGPENCLPVCNFDGICTPPEDTSNCGDCFICGDGECHFDRECLEHQCVEDCGGPENCP